jgi:hypothetical protein
MSNQRCLLAVAVLCAVLAVCLGAGGYLLARQQGNTPLSDLLLWGFVLAFGLAVLLNLLALPVGASQQQGASVTSFAQLADAYIAQKQVIALPIRGCYRTVDDATLIYNLPQDCEPSASLLGQLCQLKLQYQCQRVEVISKQRWAHSQLLSAWQEDIHFIGYFELNRLKFN